jgi:hypothetical protein
LIALSVFSNVYLQFFWIVHSKGQSRMNNSEKLAKLGAQDEVEDKIKTL